VANESKSVRLDVLLSKQYNGSQMSLHVEQAAQEIEVYISHIGSYSKKKYPNSIHWHFKQNPMEKGCLDATYWEEGNEFWIVVRNYEPRWVKDKAEELQLLLSKKLSNLCI